jgi:hypothetical protein
VVIALEKNAIVPYTPARAKICLDPIPRDLYKMAVHCEVSDHLTVFVPVRSAFSYAYFDSTVCVCQPRIIKSLPLRKTYLNDIYTRQTSHSLHSNRPVHFNQHSTFPTPSLTDQKAQKLTQKPYA